MKKVLTSILIVWAFLSYAQQQEHYSMYMQNNYLVNPAEGGTDDFTDLKVGYRTQWVDFGGGPKTGFISVHTPLNKRLPKHGPPIPVAFHGVGGAVITDQIGPFDLLTAKLSYSYHIPVTKKLMLSLGSFVGIKQYQINESDLNFSSNSDISDPLASSFKRSIVPDISLGAWGYSKKFYFGISSFQLLNSKIDLYQDVNGSGALEAHNWATAGYKVELDSNWFIVPSIVAKYIPNAPLTFDLNAKVRYQDKYWLGFSYRREDAVILLAGITIKKRYDFAYSYDITRTNVKNFSKGSHEIVFGLRLPTQKMKLPPSQFW